ncbi:hypothetical protein M153_27700010727, partial [Pseudoloma neurophilia]
IMSTVQPQSHKSYDNNDKGEGSKRWNKGSAIGSIYVRQSLGQPIQSGHGTRLGKIDFLYLIVYF